MRPTLRLTFSPTNTPLSRVHEWAADHEHFLCSENGVQYANVGTGACFRFDWDDHTFASVTGWSSVVGLELAQVLAEMVGEFGLQLDPEMEKWFASSDFTEEEFFAAWSKANDIAILAAKTRGVPPTLPRQVLQDAWRWNMGVAALEDGKTQVPQIFALEGRRGEALTTVEWHDVKSVILPRVDAVQIHRTELAPARLFRSAEPDTVSVPWAEIERATQRVAEPHDAWPGALYIDPWRQLDGWCKRLKADREPAATAPIGLVLDREYFE